MSWCGWTPSRQREKEEGYVSKESGKTDGKLQAPVNLFPCILTANEPLPELVLGTLPGAWGMMGSC